MNSLTGADRALFFIPYASLAEWQSKSDAISPASEAALDKIGAIDGQSLTSSDTALFKLEPSISTNTFSSNVGTRFIEIEAYLVKRGHEGEFIAAAKQYVKLAASHPEIHFTSYSMAFSSADGTEFLAISAYKTLAEANASIAAQDVLNNEMNGKDVETIYADASSARGADCGFG